MQPNEWINVEDETPPTDTLIWGYNGISVALYELVWWGSGYCYSHVDDAPHRIAEDGVIYYDSDIDDEYQITHWQLFEMPYPPKEEE